MISSFGRLFTNKAVMTERVTRMASKDALLVAKHAWVKFKATVRVDTSSDEYTEKVCA